MSHRWLGVALLLALAANAQEPATQVWICLPEPLAQRALSVVRAEVGEVAVVRIVPPELLADEVKAQPGLRVLFGVSEFALQHLAHDQLASVPQFAASPLPQRGRDPGCRYLLPWSTAYGLVLAPGRPTPGTRLEVVARNRDLQDRLGLCAPEVDPGPWVGSMAADEAGNAALDAGVAVWEALDARASYQPSYAVMLEGLATGRLDAGLLPVGLAAEAAASWGMTRVDLEAAPVALFGLGVLAGERLPPHLAALAAKLAGIGSGTLGLADSTAAMAVPELRYHASYLHHFAREFRGRGRSIEQLDEWLDIGFSILFAVFLVVVYLRLRRSEPDAQPDS